MAVPFSRTTRALDGERGPGAAAVVLLALVLLGAWLVWFVFLGIPVYELSDEGRLEVESAVHPVASPVEGRVTGTRLLLGRAVGAGDVLVELEADAERLALAEADARLVDVAGQMEALRAERAVGESGLRAHRASREVGVQEARARAREAEERAALAEEEARRSRALVTSGGLAALDWERMAAEGRAGRATAEALQLGVTRQERDTQLEENDRRQRLAELERRQAELAGQLVVERARREQLLHAVSRRRVVAPIAGRIGDVLELEPGAVVRVGDRLASIVPAGELRASALFPVEAMGRIRSGQPARLRLSGFPWTEYGLLPAQVAEVAREPREGRFRVDLRLLRSPGSSIPVAHGLPGTVEVEVERTTPLRLLLGTVGRALRVSRPETKPR